MLYDGLEIAIVGMGVVFLILSLLVLSIQLSAIIIQKLGINDKKEPTTDLNSSVGKKTQGGLIAVISAAISMHRKNKGHEK